MTNTYYSSLSGMLAASYGLQNSSNNIANMNSPGFKRNDVFYSSLGNGNGDESLGSGVRVAGKSINFNEGNYLESNNPADLAIVGQGFFIIRLKNGELHYTRDGEFEFHQGILIDKHSGGQVQGYDRFGTLVPIHEKGPKTLAGKASHELFISGTFVRHEKTEKEPGPFQHQYENIRFKLATVYDAQGKEHTLTIEFESTPVLVNGLFPSDDLSWDLLSITCDDDLPITYASEQKIIFENTNAGVIPEQSSIHFTLNDDQHITINFGDFNDGAEGSVELKEAKNNPEGTQIQIDQNDGYGEGKQISFSFDENGQIVYYYDNGQSSEGIHVGLARFDFLEHNLIQTQDNLFKIKSDKGLHIGRANMNGMGTIKAKQLETSNVDSTREFANIVLLQRMFQACSQIMDIDKQLLEELETKS